MVNSTLFLSLFLSLSLYFEMAVGKDGFASLEYWGEDCCALHACPVHGDSTDLDYEGHE